MSSNPGHESGPKRKGKRPKSAEQSPQSKLQTLNAAIRELKASMPMYERSYADAAARLAVISTELGGKTISFNRIIQIRTDRTVLEEQARCAQDKLHNLAARIRDKEAERMRLRFAMGFREG